MSDNNKPEQAVAHSLDSIKEKHLKVVRDQVEEAKDPAAYETYHYSVSEVDQGIRLFAARRKGLNHIAGKIPCQDYCLTASVNNCTILADADGVSSCEHSDVGAKLACEAVVLAVKAASRSCAGEEQLVSRLMSVPFRDRLVSIWIKNVMEEAGKGGTLPPENQLIEFSKYGSTIMYAVLTDHWIVVGNLGDGQILVFNDHYGVKLRVHAPKDSSRVRCLINGRCAREDFLVAKYPRGCFNGVLLSTDGMYESLDKGRHLFDYCIQMKERFLGRTPNEPYQAFCYKEESEPYKDFSRMRTQDDCSIVMAVDEREAASDHESVMAGILRHAQDALLQRWSPECMSFYIKMDNAYADVVVSRGGVELPDQLESAVLEVPDEMWSEESLFFARYADTDLPTIEFMHCTGMLRRDKSDPIGSEQRILNVYLRIRKLQKELSELGLELNSSAIFNIFYDGETLRLRKEAVKKREDSQPGAESDGVEKCFSHLLGVLESESGMSPIFDIGYIDRGVKQYRANDPAGELAQLFRVNKELNLKNISSYSWRLEDGTVLPPGNALTLAKEIPFTLLDGEGKDLEKYRYISKELL